MIFEQFENGIAMFYFEFAALRTGDYIFMLAYAIEYVKQLLERILGKQFS